MSEEGKPEQNTTYLKDVVIRLFQTPCDRFALQKTDSRQGKEHVYARIMSYLSGEHAPIEPQLTRNVNELDIRRHLLTHNQVNKVAGNE